MGWAGKGGVSVPRISGLVEAGLDRGLQGLCLPPPGAQAVGMAGVEPSTEGWALGGFVEEHQPCAGFRSGRGKGLSRPRAGGGAWQPGRGVGGRPGACLSCLALACFQHQTLKWLAQGCRSKGPEGRLQPQTCSPVLDAASPGAGLASPVASLLGLWTNCPLSVHPCGVWCRVSGSLLVGHPSEGLGPTLNASF